MKLTPHTIQIAKLLQQQLEHLKEGADYERFSTFLERRKLLTNIYEQFFPKYKYIEFIKTQRPWDMTVGDVQVSLTVPDTSIQKENFLDIAPLNLQCVLEENGEIYALTLPFQRHNIEACLVGIVTTNKEPYFINYLDASLSAKGFLDPTSYKWLTRETDFLNELYPEEHAWVNKLVKACFAGLEELNIRLLQSAFINGRTKLTMQEVELLKAWSHYYVRYYEDYVSDKNSEKHRLFEFKEFAEWATLAGYKSGQQLIMVNETLGFTPDNLTWSKERKEKQPVEFLNAHPSIKKPVPHEQKLSKKSGLPVELIRLRANYGWKDSELLRPIREKAIPFTNYKYQVFHMQGKTQTLHEWSKELKIPLDLLAVRLKKGLTEEEIVGTYSGNRM